MHAPSMLKHPVGSSLGLDSSISLTPGCPQWGDGQNSPWERPGLSMALQVTQAWAPSSRCGLTPAFTMLLDLANEAKGCFQGFNKIQSRS